MKEFNIDVINKMKNLVERYIKKELVEISVELSEINKTSVSDMYTVLLAGIIKLLIREKIILKKKD